MNTEFLTFRIFFVGLVVFLLLDGIWLGLIENTNWKSQIKKIQRGTDPIFRGNYGAIVYTSIILSIILFVLPMANVKDNTNDKEKYYLVLIYGALFGFFSYSIFDFTNLALFYQYELPIAIRDVLWGTFATSVCSWCMFYFYKNFI